MNKLKKVVLSVFVVLLAFMPIILVGCGGNGDKVLFDRYYYSYAQDEGAYRVFILNDEENIAYGYTCEAGNIEEVILCIEQEVVEGVPMPYTIDDVEGKEVIILEGDGYNVSLVAGQGGNTVEYILYRNDVEMMKVEFKLYQ